MECRVSRVECKVYSLWSVSSVSSVECVKCVECKMRSVKCTVWSGLCGVGGRDCGV